jgi:coiled-coil domain-containing protein 151
VNAIKQKADLIHTEVNKMKAMLSLRVDKLRELEGSSKFPSSENSSTMRQIRILENRLDKAMIKYNEGQSIHRTYQQILKRLRDERISFDNQLASIERTLKSKEHDYEELLLLSHDAYHAKEMAQAELHRFEQGVMEERNQRDKEVQEKKVLVQQRVEMNRRLEQRERMLKQQQDLDKAGELALKTTSAMAELAAGMSRNEAEEQRERLFDYEEAFRRIKEATGVNDVNEVIQKFLTQEDTHGNLMALIRERDSKIEGGSLTGW